MVTYRDLYHLELSGLEAAQEELGRCIHGLKRLSDEYDETVLKTFLDTGWDHSMFDAHEEATRTVKKTGEELEDAVVEAKALRSVLQEVAADLAKHKSELHRLAHEEAPARGLRVSDTGRVTPVRDPSTYEPGGDIENVMSQAQAEVTALTAEIGKVLEAAREADEVAATALRRSAGKADEHGFNDRTVSMDDVLDEREARRVAELLEEVDGDLSKLSAAERAEVERLLAKNRDDGGFYRSLLNNLGPEGTLEFAQNLAVLRQDGDPHGTYAALERSLANGIGAAAQDRAFFDRWREEMSRLGTEYVSGTRLRGYQVLANLLRHGEDYPPHLLTGLTDDIIEAEKEASLSPWERSRSPGQKITTVDDPLDIMLGIMGRHPDTATAYLDPSTEAGSDRLDYLLEDRKWPQIREYGDSYYGGGLHKVEPENTRVGLGQALEAAVRGEEAGSEPNLTEHTPAQQRIMDRLITHFGGDTVEGTPVHPNLRQALGNALADYTAENHRILTGDYASQHQNPHQLIRFMRGVAEDPEAYATMYQREHVYIAERITTADSPEAVTTEVREGGEVLGVYDEVRADVLEDEAENSNWNSDVVKHIVSEPVSHIPGVGGAATRVIELWMADVAEDLKTKAATEVAEQCLSSENAITELVEEWATSDGQDPDTAEMRALKHEGQAARFDGKERAAEALGR